jgi:hypothetical protein
LAGRSPFTRGGYTGAYDLWEACGTTTSTFVTIAAAKANPDHVIYMHFLAAEKVDLAILDRMLVTLEFDPTGL